MTTYGVTGTGFVRKPLATIIADLEAAMKDGFGANIALDSDSVYGKVIGCVGQPLSELWEVAQAVYGAFYPSTSEGTSLDNASEFVGVIRQPATKSTVKVVLEGVVGTAIAALSKIATSTTSAQFQSKTLTTLSASVAVKAETSLVGSVTNGKVYTITINGTPFTYTATVPPDDADAVSLALEETINAGAEPVTATDLTGGELQIDGDDDADGLPTPFTVSVNANVKLDEVANLADCESVEYGPIVGFAGTITEIVTPLSGWTAATNPLDASLGSNDELDSALRTRRVKSLATPGAGTVEAIRAALLAVLDVTDTLVRENTGDVTDGDGLPPHSFESVLLGGDEDDIAEETWEKKGAGIATHGSTTKTVKDTMGFDQSIKFSRPTSKLMWIKGTYSVDAEAIPGFPSNGEALMKAALLVQGNLHTVGSDVLPVQFVGPVTAAVTGVKTLLIEVKLDGGSYQTTPYTIDGDELAKFDSARITVTT